MIVPTTSRSKHILFKHLFYLLLFTGAGLSHASPASASDGAKMCAHDALTSPKPTAFAPQATSFLKPEDFPADIVLVTPPPAGLTEEQVAEAVIEATKQWSSVPCSVTDLRYGGSKDITALDEDDVPLAFGTPDEIACLRFDGADIVGAAPCDVSPNRLGVALNTRNTTWYMIGEQGGWPTPDQLDATPPMRYVDVTAALTHELGHLLGLGHPPADIPLATMAAFYRTDASQATLSADDRAGLCVMLPDETNISTCERDAECRTRLGDPGASCARVEGYPHNVCEQHVGALGSICSARDKDCEGVCLLTSTDEPQTGYCTHTCEASSDCPGSMYCDMNLNKETPSAGLCRFEEVEPSCSHTKKRAPVGGALLVALAMMIIWRRRRSR